MPWPQSLLLGRLEPANIELYTGSEILGVSQQLQCLSSLSLSATFPRCVTAAPVARQPHQLRLELLQAGRQVCGCSGLCPDQQAALPLMHVNCALCAGTRSAIAQAI